MMQTLTLLASLAAVTLGCAPAKESSEPPSKASAPARVMSSNGFSFLPPQEGVWTEQFEPNQILYVKETEAEGLSFYTGAIEGSLSSTLPDKQALIAFVQSKKNDWGEDARYFDAASAFRIEEKQETCVRYSLSAKDREAKDKGSHEFSVMLAEGRFCLHPHNRAAAVDIFYSVRHVPQHDASSLISEGEVFLSGLQF